MQEIFNTNTNEKYSVAMFLGKGGFAKCFQLVDKNKKKFAGKIIPKTSCKRSSNKEKLMQEIKIHNNLQHENIVQFISYFEDEKNIYIILELCTNKSMAELMKRRTTLLVPEVRYYTKQIVLACQYLHENLIIHRDLKLANVFLDSELRVKLGDFGLATRLNYDDEIKKTMCGTPNYMAPEILNEDGHSFEVDVWSIGVIIYTLIIGVPPFETDDKKSTYQLIKSNHYNIPYDIDEDVQNIITSILEIDVKIRPSLKKVLEMEFFKNFTPSMLPLSSLSCPPRFPNICTNKMESTKMLDKEMKPVSDKNNKYYYLIELEKKIRTLINDIEVFPDLNDQIKKPCDRMGESEDPKLAPVYWIGKWIDFSESYGFSYQLNDNSTGALFNDDTVMLINNAFIQYIDEHGVENILTPGNYPETLFKKIDLIKYFESYMNERLKKAGLDMVNMEAQNMARLPYLKNFMRNKMAIMFYLSNGTLQVNFSADHIKLILCPIMEAVTFIGGPENSKTFNFHALKENGISQSLFLRLKAVINMIKQCTEYFLDE